MVDESIGLTYSGVRVKKIYKWNPFKPTSVWVEENVKLDSASSPISGNMRLRYTPHVLEVFEDRDRPEVYKQVLMWSSQTAKTVTLFNMVAKELDTDPTPCQLMIPTATAIPRYLDKKLNPFLNGIKSLKTKTMDYTSTEKLRNRGSEIRVAGGGLSVTGSSRGDRKSLSIKYFYADEIAEFEAGAVSESIERTKSYSKFFRKILLVSTMESPNDEINTQHESCDTHKQFEIRCYSCREYFYPESGHLNYMSIESYGKPTETVLEQATYKSEAMKTVSLECPNCGCNITSELRDKELLNGGFRWNITKGTSKGLSIGYRANALAMFFTPLDDIVELLIDAEFSPITGTLLDKIYRGYFNEFYKNNTVEISKNDILLLSNKLSEKEIPEDTYKLYLTIDTQKTGFWFKVTAFEYGMRMHTILHGFVETFDELELLMGYRFKDKYDKTYIIDKTMIDRMGIRERTVEVDLWIEKMIVENGMEGMLYPSMGVQNDTSGRLWYYTTLTKDITSGDRRDTPVQAVKLNNTLLKNELQNFIDRGVKKAKNEDGYVDAFKRLFFINEDIVLKAESRERSVSIDYERQMTSEQFIYYTNPKTGKTDTTQSWQKINNSVDNHLWDCSVAAMACALMDNVSLAQKPDKTDFEDAMSLLGM